MDNRSDSHARTEGANDAGPAPDGGDTGPSLQEAPDELDRLWAHAEARWDEPKSHDLFVQACLDAGRLDFAARQYKAESENAARYAIASKRMQAVVFLATQALEQARSTPAPKNHRWLMLIAAVVCSGSIAILAYALTR